MGSKIIQIYKILQIEARVLPLVTEFGSKIIHIYRIPQIEALVTLLVFESLTTLPEPPTPITPTHNPQAPTPNPQAGSGRESSSQTFDRKL